MAAVVLAQDACPFGLVDFAAEVQQHELEQRVEAREPLVVELARPGHECVTPALPLERAHASSEDYARVVIDALDGREDELFDDRWSRDRWRPRCQRAERSRRSWSISAAFWCP